MKKLFILLFIVGISTQLFAEIKTKHIVGKWKYLVETPDGNMAGTFKFIEKEGVLAGDVITDNGYTLPITKIEIKENNTLYLEVKTDSDLIKVTIKIDGKKFRGTGTSYQGEAPISGEKVE